LNLKVIEVEIASRTIPVHVKVARYLHVNQDRDPDSKKSGY
jgi:hypothetical protein